MKHAIAVLIGQTRVSHILPAGDDLEAEAPRDPRGDSVGASGTAPGHCLAERAAAQANAEIGVARAAYFPAILLSATGGLGNSSASNWFTWPSRFWSVGPGLAETVFGCLPAQGDRPAISRNL